MRDLSTIRTKMAHGGSPICPDQTDSKGVRREKASVGIIGGPAKCKKTEANSRETDALLQAEIVRRVVDGVQVRRWLRAAGADGHLGRRQGPSRLRLTLRDRVRLRVVVRGCVSRQ